MVREACGQVHLSGESQLLSGPSYRVLPSVSCSDLLSGSMVWEDSGNEELGTTNALVFLVGISFSSKHHINSFTNIS